MKCFSGQFCVSVGAWSAAEIQNLLFRCVCRTLVSQKFNTLPAVVVYLSHSPPPPYCVCAINNNNTTADGGDELQSLCNIVNVTLEHVLRNSSFANKGLSLICGKELWETHSNWKVVDGMVFLLKAEKECWLPFLLKTSMQCVCCRISIL